MKKLLLIFLVLFCFGFVFPEKIKVVSSRELVEIVKNRITKIRTFSGSFVYSIQNKTFFGSIKYKSPNKFLFSYYGKNQKGEFYDTGSKILSDGKNLWIYLKDQNIAIRETLLKDKRTPMIGWNIERLLKEYAPMLPKEGYTVSFQNKKAYKLNFIPKNPASGFNYINLIFSEEGDILKVEAKNQLGNTIELAIKYEKFNENIPDTLFEFLPDENTQIFENVLVPEEEKKQ